MNRNARTHEQKRAHTHARTRSLTVSPVRRWWMSSQAQVMAYCAPLGYVLSDEQEYLQAYEDVLEKYKGRIQIG